MTSASICVTAIAVLVGLSASGPLAQAIPPPSVDPARVPADARPEPEEPMRQSNVCARTTTVAEPDVTAIVPGFTMLNVSAAWQYSTGHGVPVAVIDTGINPTGRLPVVAGGDYVMAGDGLTDCDAHGTIVASVIAAAPQGIPMPAPMPAAPAFPAPTGPPPVNAGTPPIADQPDEDPDAPAPPPDATDGVVGVAPHAVVISIRQSSRAYEPINPRLGDAERHQKAGTVATLAKAIVHAADMGAKVINVSVASCVSAADPLDQSSVGAAVWYAATVKDAVIVAAAGNEGEDSCAQNPVFDPLDPSDPRDWHQVKTVSSPSWFADYVLSVGAVDNTGVAISKSLAGPWVAAAAPGIGIMGLSPQTGAAVNGYPPVRPGEQTMPFWGTSFSAAYVSGVAALVRAKYPELSAHQIINRILQTTHNPPRGVDNQVGHGVVDPVAALTFDIPPGERIPPATRSRMVLPAAPPPAPDYRARTMALVFAGAVAAAVLVGSIVGRVRRAR
ncbi:type VII secretion-associated serine protease mycosin [Mycobacterium kyorinense]|uniref:Type VII secretion-associated serine protease mycosin n=1 Tax=Mycobacterium kyorinense TaxID=487514 RepID=A0A1A2ZVH5_9MYCO|nr:type VII secretion-associated serine protease mycosin [Mycobacterium kyorinense]OBI53698.1 type VII secretion-associated serine protease mycosin [Mycobacterium kyorinense]